MRSGYSQPQIYNDPTWRYKMSKVIISRSSDGFTFDNIEIICKEIKREHQSLIQFLNKELSTSFQNKKSGIFVKKSDLTQNILQDCIYKFIDYCVNCKICKSPDTNIKGSPTRKKDGDFKCDSCGKISNYALY